MTGEPMGGADASLERQALAAIRQLRNRVEELERGQDPSMAVIGIGCRLPGAENPEAYWRLLEHGVDAVRPIPDARWDRGAAPLAGLAAERAVPAFAGLLDRIDEFDAEFFGVAPREARLLDPQQRLFLEVVWEALESGGIRPASLHGTRTGVFVGVTTTDYLARIYRTTPLAELDAYAVTGNTINATAGRTAFFLGANGPAITMDTACSSGLVAVDRACRSLRERESDVAIAGGVNLLIGPEMLVSLSRWGMLAPDGRCKTFDASANGFVRAEGCGVVVLKRLADAERDGDPIFAVLRGSAVNQDGASSGLSVPNGLAQQAVLRDALRTARLTRLAVGYVEAHGTGTALGDPIELEALAAVYGHGRSRAEPLRIGSVKTNIGHLEAASGVAGLLKVILALRHRTIPRQLHFTVPTPHFPWDASSLSVVGEPIDWVPIEGRRIAGVSSFGFSGTNAHVVVEEAPSRLPAGVPTRSAQVVTLAAKSAAALRSTAGHYAEMLRDETVPIGGFAAAVSAGRTHFGERAAVVASDRAGLVAALDEVAAGRGDAAATVPSRVGTREGVAFLFTGQGSQYLGMGLGLAAADPVFHAALERVAGEIDRHLNGSILAVIEGRAGGASIDDTAYTQPALFALQVALAEFWVSRGVRPALVIGHSIGELAAACVAGVLDLADAARVVVARARLMQGLPSGGAMAAIAAPADEVAAAFGAVSGIVALAGLNAPDETVIAGEAAAVDAVAARFGERGVTVRRLVVSHPFHSPLMAPMLGAFADAIAGLTPRAPSTRVISTVTGQPVDATFGSVEYWVRQIVEPVRYADAARGLAAFRIGAALEIGPHPVLAGLGQRCLPDAAIAWLPSLRRGHDDWTTVCQTIARGYRRGVIDDWSGAEGAAWRGRVAVPTYPFQRSRHWVEWVDRPMETASPTPGRSLLGTRLPLATDDRVFQRTLDGAALELVRDHRVFGRSVVPGAAWVATMLAAAQDGRPVAPATIENVTFHAPLELSDREAATVQTVARPRTDGGLGMTGSSLRADGSWVRHVSAELAPASPAVPGWEALALDGNPVDLDAWYASLQQVGVTFGQSFRSVVDARADAAGITGRIRLTGVAADGSADWLLSPTLLDGCFQLAGMVARAERALIPARIDRLHWYRAPGSEVVARARVQATGGGCSLTSG